MSVEIKDLDHDKETIRNGIVNKVSPIEKTKRRFLSIFTRTLKISKSKAPNRETFTPGQTLEVDRSIAGSHTVHGVVKGSSEDETIVSQYFEGRSLPFRVVTFSGADPTGLGSIQSAFDRGDILDELRPVESDTHEGQMCLRAIAYATRMN